MKIGIDYTSAAHQGAGIGRLTRNVVRALAEVDHENEYTLLVQGRGLPYPPGTPHPRNAASGIPNANFREVRTFIDERWWNRIWHRARLPVHVESLVGRVDLFHSPDFTLPPMRSRTKSIVTIHDLSFLRLPNCFEHALLEYLTSNVPRAVQRADWVLADSENTRQDVIELLDVDGERVTVLYPGVEPRFRQIDDAQLLSSIQEKYVLPPRFVLSLGTIQPRKNYAGLIRAFARLSIDDLSLVIVGGRGWLYDDIFSQVQSLGLEGRVLFPGFVEDADLPGVYNLAEAFALPSLYEGFGIPPLEAMACGTPVVVADNSSLPEVVGDAGLLVDAHDTESLVEALSCLVQDTALRQTCIERGLVQAERFTWPGAARTLLKTYRLVGET